MIKLNLDVLLSGFLMLLICSCGDGRETKSEAGKSTSEEDPTLVFHNPIVPQRADPWVYKDKDGYYYLIATVPEYDRIELRRSKTINGLGTAEPKVIWTKHQSGIMGHHIWAPELHKINGSWYVYFAAGEAEDIWNIRMYVLSNDAGDPMTGLWKEEGQIKTQRDSFSLDATTFTHRGERYLAWAQSVREEGGTSILLSKMESPVKLSGKEVEITHPEYDWERIGYFVNEGPAVIKRNGKIFMTYSASATDQNYAIGLLWADEDADLLNPQSWHKSKSPVLHTNEELRRYGPGHNSFTVSEDGKTDILIYHARVYKKIRGNSLYDFNRHTRARVLEWDQKGFPDFRQEEPDNPISL